MFEKNIFIKSSNHKTFYLTLTRHLNMKKISIIIIFTFLTLFLQQTIKRGPVFGWSSPRRHFYFKFTQTFLKKYLINWKWNFKIPFVNFSFVAFQLFSHLVFWRTLCQPSQPSGKQKMNRKYVKPQCLL